MPQTPLTDQAIVGVTNAGAQFSPAVAAFPNGSYVVVWLDNQRNASYGQLYDAAGQRVGEEFQIAGSGGFSFPSVAALTGGGFVVSWEAGGDIYAQRYAAGASPLGGLLPVNAASANTELHSRVTALDNGGFLVTWDTIAAGNYLDITGCMYDSLGQGLGAPFTLNTTTIEFQAFSAVAALPGGGFVATWQSVRSSGIGVDVIGQRFDSLGGKIGGEFQANISTTNSMQGNDVARLSDGGFVVTWVDPVPNGGGGRVVARHYDANGNAVGGEIEIALKASGGFAATSVTALADGGYLVAFTDMDGASEASNNVVGQAMGANDLPAGGPFDVSAGSVFSSVLTPDGLVTLANGHVVFTWDGPSTGTSEDVYFRMYEIGGSQPPGGGGPGPDVLDGTSGDDTLDGMGGADILSGMEGNDTLIGGLGNDRLAGGAGNDAYRIEDMGDIIVEEAGGGIDGAYVALALGSYTLQAGAHVELLSAIDPASTAGLNLTGNAYSQTLIGTNGANVLIGGGGGDVLAGLGGNDIYRIEDPADFILEGAGGGYDSAYVALALGGYALQAGAQVELLSAIDTGSTAAFDLTGNEFAQTLVGTNGANVLIGGGGGDVMTGLGGNDLYRVEHAADLIQETAGGGYDAAYVALALGGYTLQAGVELELLSAIDPASTSALNLTGNALGNTIIGTNGANVLNGGGGADVLLGLGGADSFAFTQAPGGGNVVAILDFVAGTDKIALDDSAFAALGSPGALAAGAFATGSAATEADDRIVYDSATGRLFYDADGSGAGGAILFATLQGAPILAASDFIVI